MTKSRLEAFSDGVIAILITIMVLELKVPHAAHLSAEELRELIPVFLSYVLSFLYLGIYWNNHHHLFQAVKRVNGPVLWANLHLLFWLSLVPFATGWMGTTHFATKQMALYGFTLLMAGFAYYLLAQALVALHGPGSTVAQAIGKDFKGRLSLVLYLLGIGLAFVHPAISGAIYVLVAVIWLVPDRRIEGVLEATESE